MSVRAEATPPETPVPEGLAPMLAVAVDDLPRDAERYAFEFKWDGMRALAEWDGRELRLANRRRTVTGGYPELAGLGRALAERGHRAVLDGEIVTLDDGGRPSFERLQHRMGVDLPSPRLVAATPVAYLVFDLLWLDGRLLVGEPYTERRALLEALALDGPHWQVPPAAVGDGEGILAASRAMGLEGVVAKRLDSPYEPGARSRCWLKVKNRLRQEFVVGGWMPGEGGRRNRIGSLLVGYYDGPVLRFAGAVGSGLTERDLRELGEALAARRRETTPFDIAAPKRGAVYVEPEVVVEVEFTEWTEVGFLRQPVFKGRRVDKAPETVVREQGS